MQGKLFFCIITYTRIGNLALNVVFEGTPAHILYQNLGYPSDKQASKQFNSHQEQLPGSCFHFLFHGTFPKESEPLCFEERFSTAEIGSKKHNKLLFCLYHDTEKFQDTSHNFLFSTNNFPGQQPIHHSYCKLIIRQKHKLQHSRDSRNHLLQVLCCVDVESVGKKWYSACPD